MISRMSHNFGPKQAGLLIAVLFATRIVAADDQRESSVGMQARIDQIMLPGSELEVLPIEGSAPPVVMRIVEAFPHGDSYRYDIVYYALEPGKFDLKTLLKRKDGSSIDDLPSIMVEASPVLPPGQVQPNELTAVSSPYLGGYRLALWLGGIVWFLGLMAIVFVGRKRKIAAGADGSKPKSLSDRLRPLVEAGIDGKLEHSEQAELERMLLAYWRRRMKLEDLTAADAIVKLREHEDAGPLLRQLEIWLHSPHKQEDVDVAMLLSPYQNLPADALETP